MAGDDDRRHDDRDKRRPDGEKKEQTPEDQERGGGPEYGPDPKAMPQGSEQDPAVAPSAQGEGTDGAAKDADAVEEGDDGGLPEGFTAPNMEKEKEKGFGISQRDDLPRESQIHVPDYDQFLAGHGGVPGKEKDKGGQAEEDEGGDEADEAPVFDEEGWTPLEWEPGLWGAEEAAGDADDEEDEDDLRHHRFGLRLGRHQAGNFISKLKARLSRQEPTDEDDLRETEEHEAAEERIEPNERYKEVETYPIRPPYGHIRILFDEETKEYIYQIMEPVLTRTERDILAFIEESLVDSLTVSPHELEEMDDRAFITERFNDVIFDYSIILHEDEDEEDEIKRKLLYYVLRDFIGHGRIDLVMEDPYIEDISCDGPKIPVFLYHRKYESMRSTVVYPDHQGLDSFVIKMAQRSSKHISIAEPILDATLPDGSRLQATLGKEVSAGGSTFTIRKFRPDPFTPPDLVLFRTMSAEMLAYLWIAVQHSSSVLYAGGTASGKTTSLNAILLFIPPQMKIVTIEDTREVNLPHENWIAGITRHGFGPRDQFGRQAGEIDMFQLLKNALRQRPEYIIVGEVRGHEAYSLFQAMATGHAAYGTMHADSVDAVIHRLESDPINVPRNLLEALDVVSVQIQTRVGGKRVRRTKQISEIVGIDPHTKEILTNEVFRWVPKDDSFKFSGISYILERIQLEKALPEGSMVRELSRRAAIIEWMIQKRIQDYREVSRIVSAYYREPEVVMGIVEGKLTGDEIPQGLREIAERTSEESEANPLSAAALEGSKVSMDPSDETGEDAAGQSRPEAVATAGTGEQEGAGEDPTPGPAQHEEQTVSPQAAQASDPTDDAPAAPDVQEPPSSKGAGDADKRPAPVHRTDQPDPSRLLRSSRESTGKDWGAGAQGKDPAKDQDPVGAPKPQESEQDAGAKPSPVGLWGGGPGLLDAAKRHAQAEEELKRKEAVKEQEKRSQPAEPSAPDVSASEEPPAMPQPSGPGSAPQPRSHPNEAQDEPEGPPKMTPEEENALHQAVDESLKAHEAHAPPEGWSPTEAEAWLSRKEQQEREKHGDRTRKAKVGAGEESAADDASGREEDTE